MAIAPDPSSIARRTFNVLIHDGIGCGAGLWAEVDELPGCLAFADTLSRIEQDVRDAIDAYLAKHTQLTSDADAPVSLVFRRDVVVPDDTRCD